MNTSATEKLKMLNRSMRCLNFGLLGLVPFIGLPFGLAALWISGLVRHQEEQWWNAAKPQRIAGAVCGGIGVLFSTVFLGLAVVRALSLAM